MERMRCLLLSLREKGNYTKKEEEVGLILSVFLSQAEENIFGEQKKQNHSQKSERPKNVSRSRK